MTKPKEKAVQNAPTHPPKRDDKGRLLAEDGLPRYGHHRAQALAQAAKKTDPLGHVSEGLISLYRPQSPAGASAPSASGETSPRAGRPVGKTKE